MIIVKNNNNNNNDNHNNHNNTIEKYCLIFYWYTLSKQKWRRIAWSVKKILKILILKFLEESRSNLGIKTPFSKIPLLTVLF